MQSKWRKLCCKLLNTLHRNEGQDLVEYALLIALVAFAATAGMKTLAVRINTAFTTIGSSLTTYTS